MDFIKSTINDTYESTIIKYMSICKDLMFSADSYHIINYMRNRYIEHVESTCPIYSNKIFNKTDLIDKNQWYNKSYDYMVNYTNGTTGDRFEYLIWKNTYDFLERDCHYKYIIKEYKLSSNITILNMLNAIEYPNFTKAIMDIGYSNTIIHNHGIDDAYIYTTVKGAPYYNNINLFYLDIIDFLKYTKVDVILTSGNILNSLCAMMRKIGHTGKIATLISNTCEPFIDDDYEYIKQYSDYFCDHMRCWDGGATFFTCAYGTYHICDNLAYTSSKDGKLITDDYFSICSPFFNYWNGDYANVDDEILRCECGRYYRKFKLVKNRAFTISGIDTETIRQAIIKSGFTNVKMVKCDSDRLIISVSSQQDTNSITSLVNKLPRFKVEIELI